MEYDFAMNYFKCIVFDCITYKACYMFSKVERKYYLYERLLNKDLYDFPWMDFSYKYLCKRILKCFRGGSVLKDTNRHVSFPET